MIRHNLLLWQLWQYYDFVYGIHSNIPRCCIEEFIKYRFTVQYYGATRIKEYGWSDKEITDPVISKIEYVPCRKCAEKINNGDISVINKIHKCSSTKFECLKYKQLLKKLPALPKIVNVVYL